MQDPQDPSTPAKTAQAAPTLYDELGGADALEAVIAEFYRRVIADPILAPFFRGVQMSKQHQRQVQFFTQLLGGPACYVGRDMRKAHAGMGLTDTHFGCVAGHLVGTLQELGVPAAHIERVVALVVPLHDEIVENPAP